MAWITLSSRIARTLQQVTNMCSCGWHHSLAAHMWLMSVTDTTFFFFLYHVDLLYGTEKS